MVAEDAELGLGSATDEPPPPPGAADDAGSSTPTSPGDIRHAFEEPSAGQAALAAFDDDEFDDTPDGTIAALLQKGWNSNQSIRWLKDLEFPVVKEAQGNAGQRRLHRILRITSHHVYLMKKASLRVCVHV
jgi:hypothetical protein